MTFDIVASKRYFLAVSPFSENEVIPPDTWCLANDGKVYQNEIVQYREAPCSMPYVSDRAILKRIEAHWPLFQPYLSKVPLLPTPPFLFTDYSYPNSPTLYRLLTGYARECQKEKIVADQKRGGNISVDFTYDYIFQSIPIPKHFRSNGELVMTDRLTLTGIYEF